MKSSIHFTNRTMLEIKRHKIRAKFGLKACDQRSWAVFRAASKSAYTLQDFGWFHTKTQKRFAWFFLSTPPIYHRAQKKTFKKKTKKNNNKKHIIESVANINRIKTLTKRSSIKVSLTSLLFVTIVTRTVVGPCSWNWICSFW